MKLFIHLPASSLRSNFDTRNCLGWAGSTTVHEGYMCMLQTINMEWKILPVFDSYIGATAKTKILHFSGGMHCKRYCAIEL